MSSKELETLVRDREKAVERRYTKKADRLIAERDAALALLAEAWEWTTRRVSDRYDEADYASLKERVMAALTEAGDR